VALDAESTQNYFLSWAILTKELKLRMDDDGGAEGDIFWTVAMLDVCLSLSLSLSLFLIPSRSTRKKAELS